MCRTMLLVVFTCLIVIGLPGSVEAKSQTEAPAEDTSTWHLHVDLGIAWGGIGSNGLVGTGFHHTDSNQPGVSNPLGELTTTNYASPTGSGGFFFRPPLVVGLRYNGSPANREVGGFEWPVTFKLGWLMEPNGLVRDRSATYLADPGVEAAIQFFTLSADAAILYTWSGGTFIGLTAEAGLVLVFPYVTASGYDGVSFDPAVSFVLRPGTVLGWYLGENRDYFFNFRTSVGPSYHGASAEFGMRFGWAI